MVCLDVSLVFEVCFDGEAFSLVVGVLLVSADVKRAHFGDEQIRCFELGCDALCCLYCSIICACALKCCSGAVFTIECLWGSDF